MLVTGDLNQYYGGSHTLWDVNLDVPRGSCTCLMGRNGVGKTTLLRTIMGAIPAASGSIRYKETELFGAPPERRSDRRLSYDVAIRLTAAARKKIAARARQEMRAVGNYITTLVLEDLRRA